jgi:hypothetical protein
VNEIAAQQSMYTRADLAELGADLGNIGYTADEVRALMGTVEQIATQATLSMTPKLLEGVVRINAARANNLYARIQALPSKLGYVEQRLVLQLVLDLLIRPRS